MGLRPKNVCFLYFTRKNALLTPNFHMLSRCLTKFSTKYIHRFSKFCFFDFIWIYFHFVQLTCSSTLWPKLTYEGSIHIYSSSGWTGSTSFLADVIYVGLMAWNVLSEPNSCWYHLYESWYMFQTVVWPTPDPRSCHPPITSLSNLVLWSNWPIPLVYIIKKS